MKLSVANDALVIPRSSRSTVGRTSLLHPCDRILQVGIPLDLLTFDEARLTSRDHVGLAQHLANNHFDMLVVNLHTLESIDFLNLINDVLRKFWNTLQPQDVVRAQWSLRDHFALLDLLTLENRELAPFRDQLFVVIRTIRQGLAVGG